MRKPIFILLKVFLLLPVQLILQPVKIKRRPYGLMSRPYPNWARTKPKNNFPFCVPDDLSKAQIVTTISKQLTNQLETTEMLNENILKVLKTEYPCGKSNQK